MQLANTLLVTFTAIVLGLLTTSVKSGFDPAYNARGTYAAQLAQLDHCLREYGPETAPIRDQLRSYVAAVIASTWPDEPPPDGVRYPDTSKMPLTGESLVLAALINPSGWRRARSSRKTKCTAISWPPARSNIPIVIKARWAVIEGARASISTPFYWVLVFWLMILFASFGLTAPDPDDPRRHRAHARSRSPPPSSSSST